ncbi:MAG: putative sulfate exporter family transporter [Thermoleophilia bacterium]|nr:putative sulfate exporter family transporter [Thermoleophilia bacterium]MDH4346496.1 putative sulfate exporter family transporter [Thermoleophilia bacterium]
MSAASVSGAGLRTAAAAAAIGLGVFALSQAVLPGEVPSVTVALLVGLALGSFLPETGVAAMIVRRLLPLAIVLIGLQVSLGQIRALGLETLALVVAGLGVGLVVALGVARAVGVPRRLGTLLALGTAVCGNTAIVSAAPIIRARREEIAYAVATITAFGTAAVLVLPPLGHLLGLDDTQFGIWAGVGVNDTSQVVATAFAFSDPAGQTATIVKLVRNMFLGVVLVGVSVLSPDARDADEPHRRVTPRLRIPWFVWGFLAAASLGSLEALPGSVVDASEHVSKALVLVVMAAVGLSTRLGAMRAVGARPFVVGLVAMSCLSLVALAAVLAGVGS